MRKAVKVVVPNFKIGDFFWSRDENATKEILNIYENYPNDMAVFSHTEPGWYWNSELEVVVIPHPDPEWDWNDEYAVEEVNKLIEKRIWVKMK